MTRSAPTPRHIHLDAVGGVAGDMFVAAMLAALPHLRERVFADLAAVLPQGVTPRLEAGESAGIAALRFGIEGAGQASALDYREMAALIEAAPLHQGTAAKALAILRLIAEAESLIHDIPLDRVHFHEIADWDSLGDVIAAGSIAAALPDVRWSVSDLPLGSGLVQTAHGMLPVPAPATAEILKHFRWRQDGVPGERVTPTGAAIVAHLARPDSVAGGTLLANGTGAGTRALKRLPNVLRALVFGENGGFGDEIVVLSFDIDDMTGEEIAVAADRLRAVPGVLDLTHGSRTGKKGRPAADFRVMVTPERAEDIATQCFRETATIGLRWRREKRIVLARGAEKRPSEAGDMPVKLVRRPDGTVTVKIESDAVAAVPDLARRRAITRAVEDET